MRTAIVSVTDENYLPAACCALISCRRAGRATEPIFLIVSDVSDQNMQAAQAFLKKHGAGVEIVQANIDLSGYRTDRWISPAAYMRLHLDSVLDGHWQRILYLDADTRVMGLLQPLLEANLQGRPLGAIDYVRYQDHPGRLSMAEGSPYFNSGVLLFDWRTLLCEGLLAKARCFAQENARLCELWDQDALNKVFEGLWMPLDRRWNVGYETTKHIPLCRAFIKHYTRHQKPWSGQKRPCWFTDAMWYRRMLRKSPWRNFAQPVTLHDFSKACRWHYNIRYVDRPRWRLADDGLNLETISKGSQTIPSAT